ncbi:MAG: sulfatase-like hydrolase/transferase [Nitrococcus sp.]|nr:sulfatase-like hydrolase/transferase [Nitrococcus sp.]
MTTVAFQGQGGGLPHAEWTLASVLKKAGYNTYFTGKWGTSARPIMPCPRRTATMR